MQVDGGVITGYLKSGREILFIRAVADKRAVNDSLGEADDKVVLKLTASPLMCISVVAKRVLLASS